MHRAGRDARWIAEAPDQARRGRDHINANGDAWVAAHERVRGVSVLPVVVARYVRKQAGF